MKHTSTDKGWKPSGGRRARSKSERDFRALLDAAVDAIIVIDHVGTIAEFSLAAQRVFGYTADEIIGHTREKIRVPGRVETVPRKKPAAPPDRAVLGAHPGAGTPARATCHAGILATCAWS